MMHKRYCFACREAVVLQVKPYLIVCVELSYTGRIGSTYAELSRACVKYAAFNSHDTVDTVQPKYFEAYFIA